MSLSLPHPPLSYYYYHHHHHHRQTTLMKHILRNTEGWRVAVLVNDMNELDIDSLLIKKDSTIRIDQMEERMVSLANGMVGVVVVIVVVVVVVVVVVESNISTTITTSR